MSDVIDKRWRAGIPHHESSEKLLIEMNKIGGSYSHEGFLKSGGDGDEGEVLMFLLDELIETGKIRIAIDPPSHDEISDAIATIRTFVEERL